MPLAHPGRVGNGVGMTLSGVDTLSHLIDEFNEDVLDTGPVNNQKSEGK